MPFTSCTVTVNNIASLSDLPNTTDGLTSTQLKQKFDQTGTDLKTYLNSTLISELESTTTGNSASEKIGGRSISAKSVIAGLSAGSLYSQLNGLHSQLNSFVSGTGFMPTTGGTFTGEVYFTDGTAMLPSISNAGDTNTGFYFPDENEIGFSMNGSQRVNFKVGEYTFSGENISGSFPKITLTNTFQAGWTPGDVIGKLDFYINDASGIGARTVASVSSENTASNTTTAADLVFKTSIFNTVETEKMRLTSSGNLGLNTTTPSEKLEVVGNVRVTGNIGVNIATSGANLHVNGDVLVSPASSKFATRFATTSITPDYQFFATGAGSAILAGRFSADASSSRIYFAKSRNATAGSHTVVQSGDQLGVLSFGGSDGTNISEGARISAEVDGTPGTNDMPGRLVFLTTADGSATPTERMRIDNSGAITINSSAILNNALISTTIAGIGIGSANTAGNYRTMKISGAAGSQVLDFSNGTNSANLSSAGAWTNASDARLKKNIKEIKYGVNTIMNTLPRSYERNDVEGNFIGFIAQELKEVVPEVVFGSEDVQYTIDYGSLVAITFKAIQEQQQTIESLQTRIELLESKVN